MNKLLFGMLHHPIWRLKKEEPIGLARERLATRSCLVETGIYHSTMEDDRTVSWIGIFPCNWLINWGFVFSGNFSIDQLKRKMNSSAVFIKEASIQFGLLILVGG